MSTVAVCRVKSYADVYCAIKRVVDLLGGIDEIREYSRVVIKINMCDARPPETGAITHPQFLDAFLKFLRRELKYNREIYVVESDATRVLADLYVKWFGYLDVIRRYNAKWLNLSRASRRRIRIDGFFLKELEVAEVFEGAYFVTMPKVKTNVLTKITCCLKNQYGCLPKVDKDVYHPVVDKVIADINRVIKPDFCLVDGVIAMGGAQGPAFGIPLPLGIVIAGKDPVAVDAFVARLLGFRPNSVRHIVLSAKAGVGSLKYRLVGDRPPKLDSEVRWLEMWLIKIASSLQRKAWRRYRYIWRSSYR